MKWWRSFRRWRKADPRPTLWQWIRGFRCAVYIKDAHDECVDYKFLGFSREPTITLNKPPPLLEGIKLTSVIPEMNDKNYRAARTGTSRIG